MTKEELTNHIHDLQNVIEECPSAKFDSDWVIGLLSRIAEDVSKLKEERFEVQRDIEPADRPSIQRNRPTYHDDEPRF